MSLTRAQWLEIFQNCKDIEKQIKFTSEMSIVARQRILNKTEHIKNLVQQVVGQLE